MDVVGSSSEPNASLEVSQSKTGRDLRCNANSTSGTTRPVRRLTRRWSTFCTTTQNCQIVACGNLSFNCQIPLTTGIFRFHFSLFGGAGKAFFTSSRVVTCLTERNLCFRRKRQAFPAFRFPQDRFRSLRTRFSFSRKLC